MKHFLIQKANGREIPCVSEIPAEAKQIVLIVHGLGASKESDSSRCYLKEFGKRGFGVFAYDQPGHGSEQAVNEEFRIGNCLESLDAVDRYLHTEYPEAEIVYFGSSYGAYLTALWVTKKPEATRKAFFRSAAIYFPEKIRRGIPKNPEEYARMKQQGYLDMSLGTEEIARFPLGLIEDVQNPAYDVASLYEESRPAGLQAAFANGEKDPVVAHERIVSFAEHHGYPITIFPGEGHSINLIPGDPEKLADLATEFYRADESGQ